MKRNMRISKNSISAYELEIMQRGVCASLLPVDFAVGSDHFAVSVNVVGVESIDKWFASDRSFVFDTYRLLLRFLRSLVQSLLEAEDYLIPAEHLSLGPGDIFIDSGAVRLMLSADGSSSFEEGFGNLLISLDERYPQAHASYLLDRLPEHYDVRALLVFLTGLELDIADHRLTRE